VLNIGSTSTITYLLRNASPIKIYINWGVTGLGLADASDSESSIDAVLWIDCKDSRIQIAALRVDNKNRAVQL